MIYILVIMAVVSLLDAGSNLSETKKSPMTRAAHLLFGLAHAAMFVYLALRWGPK